MEEATFWLTVKLVKGRMMFVTICLICAMFTKNEVQVLAKSAGRKAYSDRRTTDYSRTLWPDAIVPYVIDCTIAHVYNAKKIIRAAMSEWENRTCIRFVKRTSQRGYLLIRRNNGCWGDVGYKRHAAIISMGDGCEYKYVMVHELGHIIGFNHEHNRPDRDEHVNIVWSNIVGSMIKQFYKRRRKDKFDGDLPYDYSSIMHYRFNAFTKNSTLSTIELKDKNSTVRHRPYTRLTDLDVEKANEMYKCPDGSLPAKTNKTDELGKRNITEKRYSDSVVEVNLSSGRWLKYRRPSERIASIVVNGKEMSQNRKGMNVVLLNYLTGVPTLSVVFNIESGGGGRAFTNFIENIPRRNYFLIVSKMYRFYHLRNRAAREALRSIGGVLPRYVQHGSSFCLVGYKGSENVTVRQVIRRPHEKDASMSMKIPLAEEFSCQDDLPSCKKIAKRGECEKTPVYLMKVCQKSCLSCLSGKPCVDENKDCKKWAEKKFCTKFTKFMLRHCRVSCGICRKALPAVGSKKSVKLKQKVEQARNNSGGAGPKTKGDEKDDDDDEVDDRLAIGIRCKDKLRKNCQDWAKHGRCLTDSWVKENCLISCYKPKVCDRRQLKPKRTCSQPFGIGWDRRLPDAAFNASSSLKPGAWEAAAKNARLYMEDDFAALRIGAWCAHEPPKKNEWLRVDLGRVKKVTAVATQGRYRYYEHVKKYKLSFSRDGKKWIFYTEKNRVKVFKGNCDHITPVLNNLGRTVTARFVKFHPVEYYGGMCMRVEVYGCRRRYG